MSKILVTGGAGYIGTHTCVELLNKGEEVVILDNFSNSSPEALENVKKITGKDIKFYEGNMMEGAGIRFQELLTHLIEMGIEDANTRTV